MKIYVSPGGDVSARVNTLNSEVIFTGSDSRRLRVPAASGLRVLSEATPGGGIFDLSDDAELEVLLESTSSRWMSVTALLASVDARLSRETRVEACAVLDAELAKPENESWMRNVTYSRRIAPDWDVTRAGDYAAEAGSSKLASFFREIEVHREQIDIVVAAWDEILDSAPAGAATESWWDIASQSSLFYESAKALRAGGAVHPMLVSVLAQGLLNDNWLKKELLSSWPSRLGISNFNPPSVAAASQQEPAEKTRAVRLAKSNRNARRVRYDSDRISRQLDGIKQKILRGNIHAAERYVRDLVEYQLRDSTRAFLSKSLCNLASYSRELHQRDFEGYLTEMAVRVAPDDAWAWVQRGNYFLGADLPTDASNAFSEASRLDPNDPIAANGQAEVLRATGKAEEALAAYEDIIAIHPLDTYAQAGRANMLAEMNRFDDALEAYGAAIEMEPDNPVLGAGRAEVLKSMGRLDDALSAYELVIAAQVGNSYALNGRANTLLRLNRLPDALIAYDEAIALAPADPVPANGRADVFRAMGQYEKALQAYELTIARYPTDKFAWAGRAQTLVSVGRFDAALDAYNTACELAPNDPVLGTGKAEALRAMGFLNQAFDAYEALIARYPSDRYVLAGRANLLLELGRLEDALLAYDNATAVSPWDPVPASGRAEVLRAMGRRDEALEIYDELIVDHPGDSYVRPGRANILRELNRLDEALAAYDEAHVLAPWAAVPRTGRAEVLRSMGRLDEALAIYEEVVADYPRDRYARCGRANILLGLKRLDEALAAYDDALTSMPWDRVASNGHAEVLRAMGRWDEALAEFDSLIEKQPADSHARAGKSRVLRDQRKLDLALGFYTDLAREFPDDLTLSLSKLSLEIVLEVQGAAEAAAQIVVKEPRTDAEWATIALAGLARMRVEDWLGAEELFNWGGHAPSAASTLIFQTCDSLLGIATGTATQHAFFDSSLWVPGMDEVNDIISQHMVWAATTTKEKMNTLPRALAQSVGLAPAVNGERELLHKETDLLLLAAF